MFSSSNDIKYNAKYRQSQHQVRYILNSIRKIRLARGIENYIRPHTRLESFLEIFNCFHETLKSLTLCKFEPFFIVRRSRLYMSDFQVAKKWLQSDVYKTIVVVQACTVSQHCAFLYMTDCSISFDLITLLSQKLSKNLYL